MPGTRSAAQAAGLALLLHLAGCQAADIAPNEAKAPAPSDALSAHEPEGAEAALRQAIAEANALRQEGDLVEVGRREFWYCDPEEDTKRVLYADIQGRPRLYLREVSSDDGRLMLTYYVDHVGDVRFLKAESMTTVDAGTTFILDPAGEASEMFLVEGGEVSPTGRSMPRDWLIEDTEQAFHASNDCSEMGPQ